MSTEIQRRKTFQNVKTMSNERFWNWMNGVHSEAYFKCAGHFREAGEIVLPPRYQKLLHDKAAEIRDQWDGMTEINVQLEELTLTDILLAVQREMTRAAGIHGAEFSSLKQAREAIDEEVQEIFDAHEEGDLEHAIVEAIQAIGVIVKYMRSQKLLVGEKSAKND